MTDDCRNCVHGKPMVGVILCEIENRIKTDTTKTCEKFQSKRKQITLE